MTTAACFVEHSVVPDVVAHPPNHMLEVGSKFGESWAGISQVRYASGIQAQLGNVLTPTQVKDVPIQLRWPGANSKAHYTLCLVGERVYRRVRHFVTDPDAPSRANPQYRECVHYLVVNIPGGDVHAGNVLVEYIGSGPPMSSGACGRARVCKALNVLRSSSLRVACVQATGWQTGGRQ
jgi:hypothetical protein